MKEEELSLEEQVERIRRKRQARSHDHTRTRTVLNALFLALAAIGLGMYFLGGDNHIPALLVMAAGMVLKVVEFILRIL